LGQLKSTLYARMEEVSFRSGAAVARGLPAAIGGQGGSDPACCDARPHRYLASPSPEHPEHPATSGAARLAGLAQVAAVAMAVGPVTASAPLMIVL
jgi:hypothetical protein